MKRNERGQRRHAANGIFSLFTILNLHIMKHVYLIHFTKGKGYAMNHQIASSKECAGMILRQLREIGYKAYYEKMEVITKKMI